mmetsp:Transcript_34620/g.87460  ORF Transcript_34620/g.87460 Transcript_34620/m.87460 type:complete len:219 (-) Transcript_34620:253-909(-)
MQSLAASSAQLSCMIFSVVLESTVKSCRLRLLTPMIWAPHRSAFLVSSSLLTSTRGSIPSRRDAAIRLFSSGSSSTATMRRTVSAPCTRASYTMYSSMRKSLRRTAGRSGRAPTSSRTARMSGRSPLNHVGSVSTEIALAPALAYIRPCSPASMPGAMSPLEGEARLTSATTETPFAASLRRRALKSMGGNWVFAPSIWPLSVSSDTLAFASRTSFLR